MRSFSQKLTKAGPRRVFFDVDFSSPSNALDDAKLDAALARRRDFPVSLPTFTQYATSADVQRIVNRPLPRFARSADLVAVNGMPASDGLTREWRNYWTLEGERTPSIIDPRRQLTGEQAVLDRLLHRAELVHVCFVCRRSRGTCIARSFRRQAGVHRRDGARTR